MSPSPAPAVPAPPDLSDEAAPIRPLQAWYVVGVLMLASMLSFVDRMILSLLIAPIRAALGITDTQVSLLLGLAFALLYAVLGLPLGWVADRFNRRNLIAAGMAVWCAMTAACGAATSFPALFLARVGVGAGEATLGPAGMSMLSDCVPRARLGTAIAVFSIGTPLGAGLALLLGALLVQHLLAAPPVAVPGLGAVEAWRLTFVWVAAPGVPLLLLLLLTVKEPLRRDRLRGGAAPSQLAPFLAATWRPVGAHFAAMSLISLFQYGTLAWTPAFLIRTYGMSPGGAGMAFGAVMAVCGAGGVLAGGVVADRMYRRGRSDAHLRTVRLAVLLGGPLLLLAPLMPTAGLAFGLMVPGMLLMTMHGVAGAALQLMTPNEFRARMTALYLLCVNLVGLGLGPTAIAVVTDYVLRDDLALRYSLVGVAALVLPAAAVILTLGLGPYAARIRQIEGAG